MMGAGGLYRSGSRRKQRRWMRPAHAATEAFEEARLARHEAFITAFDHVAACIDGIFKALTQVRSTKIIETTNQ